MSMINPQAVAVGAGLSPTVPVGGAPEGGDLQAVADNWRLALREFTSNKPAVAGVFVLVFFLLFCYLGPHIYRTNQISTNVLLSDEPPSWAHLLGTDPNGFDELGRLMVGGQAALEVGFFAAAIATVIGTLYGAISGLAGGLIDGALMRFVDIMLSIPAFFIILIIATKMTPTVLNMSLVIGVFSWPAAARLVRGEVLTLRERDFVFAAQVMGSTRSRLVLRHLIPNALSVVIVNITFLIPDSIGTLAFLGFLNFGLQYPAVSWGDMFGQIQTAVSNGYYWEVYPVAIALIAVIMAFNMIGDALRDTVDVRMRRR
jgi:ABC-type dipeptide/oligopeptide/nickel transport system permease subunit